MLIHHIAPSLWKTDIKRILQPFLQLLKGSRFTDRVSINRIFVHALIGSELSRVEHNSC